MVIDTQRRKRYMSKGSNRRPEDAEKFAENYDKIFGNKTKYKHQLEFDAKAEKMQEEWKKSLLEGGEIKPGDLHK